MDALICFALLSLAQVALLALCLLWLERKGLASTDLTQRLKRLFTTKETP